MGEGAHIIKPAGKAALGLSRQPLGGLVDTTYGGYDPELIAGAGAAIGAGISLENSRCSRLQKTLQCFLIRGIGIVDMTREIGGHIVGVDVLADTDVLGGVTQGIAIFDHIISTGDVAQSYFVTEGNIVQQGDALTRHLVGLTSGQIGKGDGGVIMFVDQDQSFVHGIFLLLCGLCSGKSVRLKSEQGGNYVPHGALIHFPPDNRTQHQ